jgi:hypothetical protein
VGSEVRIGGSDVNTSSSGGDEWTVGLNTASSGSNSGEIGCRAGFCGKSACGSFFYFSDIPSRTLEVPEQNFCELPRSSYLA